MWNSPKRATQVRKILTTSTQLCLNRWILYALGKQSKHTWFLCGRLTDSSGKAKKLFLPGKETGEREVNSREFHVLIKHLRQEARRWKWPKQWTLIDLQCREGQTVWPWLNSSKRTVAAYVEHLVLKAISGKLKAIPRKVIWKQFCLLQ